MTNLPFIHEGDNYTATLSIVVRGSLTPVPLPGTIEVTLFKGGEVSPFVTATAANTKLSSVNSAGGQIVFNLGGVADLSNTGSQYGVMRVRRTDVPTTIVQFPIRFVEAGDAMPSDYDGTTMVQTAEFTVTVNSEIAIDIPPGSVTNLYLADMAAGTIKARLAGTSGPPVDEPVANLPISTATQTALDSKENTGVAAAAVAAHAGNTANPHSVTKAQVGLSNVDNTSDADKPVSSAMAAALSGKANTVHVHATDDVTEGATNKYFTEARVRAALLTGISFVSAIAVTAADSVLVATGKLQAQISSIFTALDGKGAASDVTNNMRELGFPVLTPQILPSAGSVTPSVYRSFTTVNTKQYTVRVVFYKDGLNSLQVIRVGSAAAGGMEAFYNTADGFASSVLGAASAKEIGGGRVEMLVTSGVVSAGAANNYQIRPSLINTFPYDAAGAGKLIESFELFETGTTVNLFPSSNITDASFTKQSCTTPTVLSTKNLTAPRAEQAFDVVDDLDALINGRMIATRLTEGSGSIQSRIFRSTGVASLVIGDTFEVIAYAKKQERKRLNLFSNSAAIFDAVFNLETVTAIGTGASISYVGNGFYKCTVTGTVSAAAASTVQVRVFADSGTAPRTGDGVSKMTIYRVDFKINGAIRFSSVNFSGAEWTKDGLTVTSNVEQWGGIGVDLSPNALPHPLSGKKVSIVGTSLVSQGLYTSAFAGETGATVQVVGVSGGALGLDARGSPHAGSGAITAAFSTIDADADFIILDGLPNDVAASDVPLGAIGDTTTATYYGALSNFFAWCEANRPNAKVIVSVVVPASSTYSPSDYRHGVANANGNTLEQFQDATRRSATYHGRPLIDHNEYNISYLDAGDNTGDGLHWDADGAGRVAKVSSERMRDLARYGVI